jgi:hypothetical protein
MVMLQVGDQHVVEQLHHMHYHLWHLILLKSCYGLDVLMYLLPNSPLQHCHSNYLIVTVTVAVAVAVVG